MNVFEIRILLPYLYLHVKVFVFIYLLPYIKIIRLNLLECKTYDRIKRLNYFDYVDFF